MRDKMVRLHGMGVLQTRAGCLLVPNDKRIDPNQLQDLTFCLQRKEGVLQAPSCICVCQASYMFQTSLFIMPSCLVWKWPVLVQDKFAKRVVNGPLTKLQSKKLSVSSRLFAVARLA